MSARFNQFHSQNTFHQTFSTSEEKRSVVSEETHYSRSSTSSRIHMNFPGSDTRSDGFGRIPKTNTPFGHNANAQFASSSSRQVKGISRRTYNVINSFNKTEVHTESTEQHHFTTSSSSTSKAYSNTNSARTSFSSASGASDFENSYPNNTNSSNTSRTSFGKHEYSYPSTTMDTSSTMIIPIDENFIKVTDDYMDHKSPPSRRPSHYTTSSSASSTVFSPPNNTNNNSNSNTNTTNSINTNSSSHHKIPRTPSNLSERDRLDAIRENEYYANNNNSPSSNNNNSRRPSLRESPNPSSKHRPQSTSTSSITSDASLTNILKIMMIGDNGVGKSSLFAKFFEQETSSSPATTSTTTASSHKIQFRSKSWYHKAHSSPSSPNTSFYGSTPLTTNNNLQFKSQIWDLPNKNHLSSEEIKTYLRGAHCFVVIYDVSNLSTIEPIPNYIELIREHTTKNTPIVLIGNKRDLRKRVISNEELATYVQENHLQGCYEVSALDGYHVPEVFDLISQLAYKKYLLDTKEEAVLTPSSRRSSHGHHSFSADDFGTKVIDDLLSLSTDEEFHILHETMSIKNQPADETLFSNSNDNVENNNSSKNNNNNSSANITSTIKMNITSVEPVSSSSYSVPNSPQYTSSSTITSNNNSPYQKDILSSQSSPQYDHQYDPRQQTSPTIPPEALKQNYGMTQHGLAGVSFVSSIDSRSYGLNSVSDDVTKSTGYTSLSTRTDSVFMQLNTPSTASTTPAITTTTKATVSSSAPVRVTSIHRDKPTDNNTNNNSSINNTTTTNNKTTIASPEKINIEIVETKACCVIS